MEEDSDSLFPFEFFLQGTPVSLQTKNRASADRWKARVSTHAKQRIDEICDFYWIEERTLCLTILLFFQDPPPGDIDNLIKPIMDAMCGILYIDDRCIERVVIQRFVTTEFPMELNAPTEQLQSAVETEFPVVYIRIDDDLSWRLFG